jgi:uncharacterized membrane protein
MSEPRLRTAIAVLALAGAGIASYLLYERYTGGRIACTSGGCETVQHSRYARIAGVPVALVGLVGYLALLGTAFARGELARAAAVAVALPAFAFSAYLLVMQLAVIHAICVWCVGSDTIVTLIAALVLLRVRSGVGAGAAA